LLLSIKPSPQATDRGLQFFWVLLSRRQRHDVVGGVSERDELTTARQRQHGLATFETWVVWGLYQPSKVLTLFCKATAAVILF
jgi:hypothetical protein